jgi:hypothetical protein
MASSPHQTIPMEVCFQWYKIRDTLFGDNHITQNIPLALELACACSHPDARWLVSACAGKRVKSRKQAREVFFALGENDARSLMFSWFLSPQVERRNMSKVRRAAELGYAFAQAMMAWDRKGKAEDRFKFAQLAVEQDERDGYHWLGQFYKVGEGCVQDVEKARTYFLLSSERGCVGSMGQVGNLLDHSDPQCWYWWGRAAALGSSAFFLNHFGEQVESFNAGSGSASVMFAIGRALDGNVTPVGKLVAADRKIFDHNSLGGTTMESLAIQAITFYQSQLAACRLAVHTWTQVGIRRGCEGCANFDCKTNLERQTRGKLRKLEECYSREKS